MRIEKKVKWMIRGRIKDEKEKKKERKSKIAKKKRDKRVKKQRVIMRTADDKNQ